MTTTSHWTAIGRVAGQDAVRPGGPGDAIDDVTPDVVVAPDTPEAVAAVLAYAQSARLTVVLRGGGTKDGWGRPPGRIDLALSLARLNRVIAHESGDLTVTVEAGAVLADLNRALAHRGQQLAIDAPFAAQATIGGVVAANDSGPRRHRFGAPRDLILGVTVATIDGALASAGGRVVKNVAGYDLSKLVCGSHGQLAAILSATFKLAPLPETSATVVVSGDIGSLIAVIAGISVRQLEPTAVEMELADGAASPDLLVEFQSVAPAVSAAVDVLVALARRAGSETVVLTSTDQAQRWRRHEALAWSDASVVVGASWRPAEWPRVLEAATRLGPAAVVGRVGVGAGLLRFDGDLDQQAAAVNALRATPGVGNVVVRRGAPTIRTAADPWGGETDTRRLGSAIKRAWDPMGLLGAGRGPL